MKIIEWLKLPQTRYIEDLDDPAVTLLHAEIVQKKTFLRKLYIDFYKQFRKAASELCRGRQLGRKVSSKVFKKKE